MICKNCGAEMDNNTACPSCGVSNQATYVQAAPNANAPDDNGGFLWGLLGCCIPVVGLILFLVWKDSKPRTAKAAGIGALVSVGFTIVFYVITAVIGLGAAGVMGMGMDM